jgi:TolC family type I secretion outer membrane protein
MKLWMTLVAAFVLCSVVAAAQDTPAHAAMSLRDAVNYGLAHSPELKASQAEVQRRQGGVTSARAALLPQVDLSTDALRTRIDHGYPFGASPSLLRFDTALYTGGADAKWLAWDFGRTELELAAARERVESARAGVDRRRQELVFETARLYLQTLSYTDLIGAGEARVASLQSLLDRTNQLVAGGRAVPVDALKIQTRLAEVESSLATLRSGRRSSLSALAAVMGFEGDLPTLSYSSAVADLPPPPRTAERDDLGAAAASRPDLASQDHEVRAAEKAEAAARKSTWPRIDLRASVVEYGSNNPLGFGQLIGRLLPSVPAMPATDNAVADWAVGVHVTVPLFDGGRRRGQVQAAAAQLDQARLARQQLGLRVEREVRTALADLDSARSRVAALRDSVAESERVLHDERLKYDAGRSVINFVLDAESALLTSQSLLSQAERSVATAMLALDLSVGRIDVTHLPER